MGSGQEGFLELCILKLYEQVELVSQRGEGGGGGRGGGWSLGGGVCLLSTVCCLASGQCPVGACGAGLPFVFLATISPFSLSILYYMCLCVLGITMHYLVSVEIKEKSIP